jgi:predicted RNase H-related nuclease YkuK (DUF458 family)
MLIILRNNRIIRKVFYGLCILSGYTLLSAAPNEYIIFKDQNFGFFAVVSAALGMLEEFEQKKCSGVKIDLVGGLYHESHMGSSWWHYYFQPLEVGKNMGHSNDRPDIGAYAGYTLCKMSRKRGYFLIRKYIKIRPYVQRLVDNFYNKNLTNAFLIGVHYRGTDKSSEAARTEYDQVFKALENKIKSLNGKPYKIFVATDEQNFINAVKSKFGNIYYTNAIRSTNGAPVHYNNSSHFKHGLECLIDALLLARCNTLIRTASNVSNIVSMLNPTLEVINLSYHIWSDCNGRSH